MPKFRALYAKKRHRLEKSTPPPIVAVVTNIRYDPYNMKHSVSADCSESLRSLWAPSVVRRGPAADECERIWNLGWRIDFCVSLRKLAQRLPILISRLHFWNTPQIFNDMTFFHFLFYKNMQTKPCFFLSRLGTRPTTRLQDCKIFPFWFSLESKISQPQLNFSILSCK